MNIRIIILLFLALTITKAYTEENNILILNNQDLKDITKIFPHLLIKFEVPWCRHCKQLAPILIEVAKELKQMNSEIRIATINCQENEDAYDFGKLQVFPTLIYYEKGQQTHFDGDRTKSYMLKWLTKRISNPLKKISKKQLQQLKSSQKQEVSIVYAGALKSISGATFANLAYQDNYNKYYYIEDVDNSQEKVLLLRSFAEDLEYPAVDDQLSHWILNHDRLPVVPLDERSISHIFRDFNLGVFFFVDQLYIEKKAEFAKAAEQWKQNNIDTNFTFVAVTDNHQDYFGLLEYFQTNPLRSPILIFDANLQKKWVFQKQTKELQSIGIIQFLQDFANGKIVSEVIETHDHNHDHDHDHHQHHHHHHHHNDQQHSHDHDHNHQHHQHDENCPHHHHHHHHEHDHSDSHHEHSKNCPHHHEQEHQHIHDENCPNHKHNHNEDEVNFDDNDEQKINSKEKQFKQTENYDVITPLDQEQKIEDSKTSTDL